MFEIRQTGQKVPTLALVPDHIVVAGAARACSGLRRHKVFARTVLLAQTGIDLESSFCVHTRDKPTTTRRRHYDEHDDGQGLERADRHNACIQYISSKDSPLRFVTRPGCLHTGCPATDNRYREPQIRTKPLIEIFDDY